MMAREPVSTTTASSEGESLFLGALAATLFGSFHKRKRPNRYAAGRLLGRRERHESVFFCRQCNHAVHLFGGGW
jgi:hypothetical protein